MKRILTTGLVLLSLAGTTESFAQGKRVYDDDIYYNSKTARPVEPEEERAPAPAANSRSARTEDRDYNSESSDTYTSSGRDYDNSRGRSRTSDDDDYVSLDDDYYYSTRISRFNYPFYNRPYWSSFYNPNWYDPFWVDPYWGWSPWARPGLTLAIGGGPYWSSYWGWQSWYGFGGFNSYYGGGFGYPGMYGGFYSGYWNGYYGGLYNNYGGYGRGRAITYGPRYSMDASRNGMVRESAGRNGFRREVQPGFGQQGTGVIGQQRSVAPGTLNSSADRPNRDRSTFGTRNEGVRPDVRNNTLESAPIRSSDDAFRRDRGADVRSAEPSRNGGVISQDESRTRWNNGGAVERRQAETPAQQPRERGSWFGGGRSEAPARSFEQPRFERSAPAPRMEAPSRSFGNDGGSRGGFGGGRSMGGGSGGGGFRGGRR